MKLKGRKIEGPNKQCVVFPRGNAPDIVLWVEAILDAEEFERKFPRPTPPVKMLPGPRKVSDFDDPIYKVEIKNWADLANNWTFIKSLQATEELEWEKIDMNNPSTFIYFDTELKESGFSAYEIIRIKNLVYEVNCLDENKLEEARSRFLLSRQEQQNELSSQPEGLVPTPTGEQPKD